MKRLELRLTPAQAADVQEVRRVCARHLRTSPDKVGVVVPLRRSIDARKGDPIILLTVEVHAQTPAPEAPQLGPFPPLRGSVVLVGAGPAGYFAALELLMLGLKPVLLERGKDTRARRYDLRNIMQESRVDPNSNYCFGEGGAGTYSDGKLYTRADKRGDVTRVLRLLVEHGARSDILVDAHPHIGSNKLPGVVENLRQSILEHGGEVHFESRVDELILEGGRVLGARTADREFRGDALILATGHSARDIYHLLARHGLLLEAKPFALGVRIEHPQPLIDEIQYRQKNRDVHLPAASYRLAHGGVYSFCMCPGGLIVPAATAPGEIVVNGMSMSSRNSRWANSGIVCEVHPEGDDPLAGLAFQQAIERRAFALTGSQQAPAQRLVDFLEGRPSQSLPDSSYYPGLLATSLEEYLPASISEPLRQSLRVFGQKMRGFLTEEAVLVGVESRTSSPVRIPRDPETLAHPQFANLYPCAEGAGYAGGIVSAAMDGQRVARAAAERLLA